MRDLRNSIATRLFTAIAILLLAGGAGTYLLANRYGQRAAERAYDMLLAGAALEISRTVAVVEGRPRVDIPVSAFELLALAPNDRITYGVFGPDGGLITGSGLLAAAAASAEPFSYIDDKGEVFRLATLRRSFAEQSFRGEVTVVVGHTMIERAALTAEIVSQALLVVLLAGSGLFVIAVLAVRFSLSPLRRIEAELRQRDPKDLRPIQIQVPVEIGANVRAINMFMGRLSNRIEAMQGLIADASHQLLTPITALSAYAQSAAATQTDEAGRAIADEVRVQSEQIAHLARQLLNQAMIIHRTDATPLSDLDLRTIAIQVERAAETYFPQEEGKLWLKLPEQPVIVSGDDLSLIEAMKNLVANAYRYGRQPINLLIEPDPAAQSVAILVEDHGQGIDDGKWDEIGRRFDRNRTPGSGSHGLGLAITHSVAVAHGGRMVAHRSATGAFRCGMILPLAAGKGQRGAKP